MLHVGGGMVVAIVRGDGRHLQLQVSLLSSFMGTAAAVLLLLFTVRPEGWEKFTSKSGMWKKQ